MELEPAPQIELVTDGYNASMRKTVSKKQADSIWRRWLGNVESIINDPKRLELTVSSTVKEGTEYLELNHTSAAIAATISNTLDYKKLSIKATTEPAAGQDHTVTITTGTWDGTNDIATFSGIDDFLMVEFDSNGKGTVILNNSVTLT